MLSRLTICFQVALKAGEDGRESLSSAQLAELLKVDETLVRKDMATVGIVGKPRVGYPTARLLFGSSVFSASRNLPMLC